MVTKKRVVKKKTPKKVVKKTTKKKGSYRKLKKDVSKYEGKVVKLKELGNELAALNTRGFSEEVKEIKSKLKDPSKLAEIKKDIVLLKKKILRKKKQSKKPVKKKVKKKTHKKKTHKKKTHKKKTPKKKKEPGVETSWEEYKETHGLTKRIKLHLKRIFLKRPFLKTDFKKEVTVGQFKSPRKLPKILPKEITLEVPQNLETDIKLRKIDYSSLEAFYQTKEGKALLEWIRDAELKGYSVKAIYRFLTRAGYIADEITRAINILNP